MDLISLTAGLLLTLLSSVFSLEMLNFENSQQGISPEGSLSFATLDTKLEEPLPPRFFAFPSVVLNSWLFKN